MPPRRRKRYRYRLRRLTPVGAVVVLAALVGAWIGAHQSATPIASAAPDARAPLVHIQPAARAHTKPAKRVAPERLLVGGTLVGGDVTEPHEKRNGTIEGGTRVKLTPGDIVRIPAKMPHQLLLDGSKEFTYFVVKVKGY